MEYRYPLAGLPAVHDPSMHASSFCRSLPTRWRRRSESAPRPLTQRRRSSTGCASTPRPGPRRGRRALRTTGQRQRPRSPGPNRGDPKGSSPGASEDAARSCLATNLPASVWAAAAAAAGSLGLGSCCCGAGPGSVRWMTVPQTRQRRRRCRWPCLVHLAGPSHRGWRPARTAGRCSRPSCAHGGRRTGTGQPGHRQTRQARRAAPPHRTCRRPPRRQPGRGRGWGCRRGTTPWPA